MARLTDDDPRTGSIHDLHNPQEIDAAAAREKPPEDRGPAPRRSAMRLGILSAVALGVAALVLASMFGLVGEPNRDPAGAQLPPGQAPQTRGDAPRR
jgi:hypothetical protein